jgi:hypothetical protein
MLMLTAMLNKTEVASTKSANWVSHVSGSTTNMLVIRHRHTVCIYYRESIGNINRLSEIMEGI